MKIRYYRNRRRGRAFEKFDDGPSFHDDRRMPSGELEMWAAGVKPIEAGFGGGPNGSASTVNPNSHTPTPRA